MNALATEVLAIYVQLDEARKQRLLDYVQQLLEKQRVHGAASRCGATPRGRERAGSQGLTSQHSDALYSRRRRASRTAAMRLLQAGVDTTVIALWLGHENVETTQIYLHVDLELKE